MGVLLLLIGLAVLGFGLWNHMKGKRILAAPFKKTGDLARNPVSEDPKGAISTEGQVQAPAQALLSPCTKQPCLYYEVKVERLYEKVETTQDGTKTVKGSDTLDTVKGGTQFNLDDGSGAIMVDFTKGGDFDTMKDGFKKELNGRGWSSQIQFGEMTYDIPVISSKDGYTIGFKATERYVPAEGNLFVLGKIEGASIVKPGWRSMIASSKGREGLLGSINKKKKFSFIGGGVAAVLSIPLMIFAPAASSSMGFCPDTIEGAQAKCSANVSSESGDEYTWNVKEAGEYTLTVIPPAAKKFPLDAHIIVNDAKGDTLADKMGTSAGTTVTAQLKLEPGTYNVVVKDAGGMTVKGGFSYDMEIAKAGGAAPANGEAVALSQAWADEQVAMLNEICPDTHCEGEYEYNFKSMKCEAGNCDLTFSAKNHDNGRTLDATLALDVSKLSGSDEDKALGFSEVADNAIIQWEADAASGKLAKGPAPKKAAPAKKHGKAKKAKKHLNKRMSP